MAPTREIFQTRLTDSGIMSAEELSAFADGLPEGASPDDSHALAKALVDAQRLTTYQAEVLLAEAARPLRLGNYLLLDRVGQGGMGHVHKAVHERMNRIVALKVLPPLAAMDETLVKRFRREVEVAAKLHHPHIVTAYDADEANGIHFLVMELVDGRDLAVVVAEEGPLDVDAALDCIEQAAEGLAYAHAEGVLHRDVKPANLLVDDSGHVKVLDLGLARLESSEGLTTTGEFLGTAMTMAPEQCDDVRLVDERSDVYGLGCTLHFLLTGKHVYQAGSAVQMLLSHASAPIPRLRDARPDVPASVDKLFASMVQKRREDRPASMQAVIEGIQAIRAGEAPSLPPAPAETRRSPSPRVRRGLVLGGAIGLAALAVFGVWRVLGTSDGQGEPSVHAPAGPEPGAATGGERRLEVPLLHTLRGHRDAVHAVAVHPDGRRVLSASGDGTIGVWDRETGSLLGRLEGHTDSVRSVVCLADGKTVITSSDDMTIRIWDLPTRETRKVLRGHEAKVRRLALAPDESWLVSASKDGTVRVWDLPAGTERARRSEHDEWVGDNRGYLSVAVRPDGKAFATAAFDRTVRLWDAQSLEVTRVLGPLDSDVGMVAYSADGSHFLYDLEAGHVRVMDRDATRETAYLVGHGDWVYSIACAHRAPIVATGSQDRSIRLWNYETGEFLLSLDGHEYTVGALAFSEDDRLLVSGAGDETVRLWDIRRVTEPDRLPPSDD